MLRYFKNKVTNQYRQVGEYTPTILAECLDITDENGNITKESEWVEISKEEYINGIS